MPKFKNVSNQLCIVPLPGTSVHLAPGETTRALDDFEVRNNHTLDRLVSARRLIRLDNVNAPTKGAARVGAGH